MQGARGREATGACRIGRKSKAQRQGGRKGTKESEKTKKRVCAHCQTT